MRYLVDSIILIDHLNGVPAASEFLAANETDCSISVVTRAETLVGLDPDDATAREFLDTFVTWPITVAVADTAARLRRTHRWKLPDALEAAVAFEEGLTFVTRNTRDFKHRDPVPVETPYRV